MRYPCRCRKCEARRTFRQHPESFIRPRKCACGNATWRIDRWRVRRNTLAMGCDCMGYNWGGIYHRRGSLHCWYDAKGSMRDVPDLLNR